MISGQMPMPLLTCTRCGCYKGVLLFQGLAAWRMDKLVPFSFKEGGARRKEGQSLLASTKH